ncbi:DDE-type integrase/transposase/recombinase, partial [Rhodococcus qingshengii]|uniref:DDE-type integrase/transposase/recombinase n=2 Tax=Rhodococcus TaxID=1827 RepID=UPI003969D15A
MARLGHPCRAPECFTGSLVITSVATIAGIQAREGKVFCAVVLDAFSRRVVGWSIDSSQTSALVTNALSMAISNRAPLEGTVIHSD